MITRSASTSASSVWTALACAALVSAAACTSGPAPPAGNDVRPYREQIEQSRREKDEDFRRSRDSPLPPELRASFTGLAYFPPDEQYRVPALLREDRSGPPLIIEMQTTTTERDKMRKVGPLKFTVSGVELTLTAFASVDATDMNRLFVPFGDLTNGPETYKGGRFLNLDRTPTGLYDLDFNRTYQPYCVYNPTYVCPVPPRENHLAVAIRAGEKLRDVDHH